MCTSQTCVPHGTTIQQDTCFQVNLLTIEVEPRITTITIYTRKMVQGSPTCWTQYHFICTPIPYLLGSIFLSSIISMYPRVYYLPSLPLDINISKCFFVCVFNTLIASKLSLICISMSLSMCTTCSLFRIHSVIIACSQLN